MLRRVIILVILVMISMAAFHFYKQYRRDSKIQDVTTSEAAIRKLCVSDDIKSRVKCLKPQLEELEKEDFPKSFVLIKDNNVTELTAIELKGYTKISRTSEMSFGGRCISSFYLFDFDGTSIYISKENKSGVIFCKNKNSEFIITSADLSPEAIQSEIKTLQSLTF